MKNKIKPKYSIHSKISSPMTQRTNKNSSISKKTRHSVKNAHLYNLTSKSNKMKVKYTLRNKKKSELETVKSHDIHIQKKLERKNTPKFFDTHSNISGSVINLSLIHI